MVRPLLREVEQPGSGKTQTRRPAWRIEPCPQSCCPFSNPTDPRTCESCPKLSGGPKPTIWQKARPGDRLWVRESIYQGDDNYYYSADGKDVGYVGYHQLRMLGYPRKVRPNIHMPRKLNRLTLVVSEVRRQQVQDISEEDAWQEGVDRRSKRVRQMWLFGLSEAERLAIYRRAARWEFEALWDDLHGPGAWQRNEEVVALTFTVHLANVDQMPEAA